MAEMYIAYTSSLLKRMLGGMEFNMVASPDCVPCAVVTAGIIAALAATKGGATTPAAIQENLAAVSGANGGEKCTTYADCVALIKDGKEIQYQGPSSVGPFNAKNDPSSAFIGIYKYNDVNVPVWASAVEGKS